VAAPVIFSAHTHLQRILTGETGDSCPACASTTKGGSDTKGHMVRLPDMDGLLAFRFQLLAPVELVILNEMDGK